MHPLDAKRFAQLRKQKAEQIRDVRNHCPGMSRDIIRRIADNAYGNPPRPEPEVLADYWNIERVAEGGLAMFDMDEHGESWTRKWLLPGQWSDEDICHTFGIYESYRGPGQPFAHRPHVERSKHSTLVTQSGGLDI